MLSQNLKNTVSKLNSLTAIMASGVQRFSGMHHIVTVHFIHLLYTAEQIKTSTLVILQAGNKNTTWVRCNFSPKTVCFLKTETSSQGLTGEFHRGTFNEGTWGCLTLYSYCKADKRTFTEAFLKCFWPYLFVDVSNADWH